MSFNMSRFGYTEGKLGSPSNITKSLNAYALVTAIASNGDGTGTITIDTANAYTAAYEKFASGIEILFHISAAASTDTTHLGKWAVGMIINVRGNTLDVEFDPTDTIPETDLSKYYCQVITIPQFVNIKLNAGTVIAPLPYSTENHFGGILALECSGTLAFNGGHISLIDCGIPPSAKNLRPLTPQEINGTLDTDKYAGWENAQTKDRFLLNAGDGAAFIVTNRLEIKDSSSRIGNPETYGVAFCRGSANSRAGTPANVTNIGGSTILIAADTIGYESVSNLHKMLAKYRSSTSVEGQGLCRCYIASNTTLHNDEGLFAYDIRDNPSRATEQLNIRDFGDGSFSNVNNETHQLNNYATVTAIDGAKISYTDKTTAGRAQLQTGALVMLHANHKDSANVKSSGRFFLARVLASTTTTLTLDTLPSDFFDSSIFENYNLQIISIPQYNNFTLSDTYTAVPKYDGAQGGIFAVAVEDTCDLRTGKINVEGKGGGKPYASAGSRWIGNSQNSNKLPIGEGHGSVFILANKLVMNANTRIGATYSGANFGGAGGLPDGNADTPGGYEGLNGRNMNGGRSLKIAGGNAVEDFTRAAYTYGGYGDNGTLVSYKTSPTAETTRTLRGGYQGAHIMIIADTITGFNMAAISTGGEGGVPLEDKSLETTGGAGHGGGAGYGGGGGSSHYASRVSSYGGGGGSYICGGCGGHCAVDACFDVADMNAGAFGTGGGGSGWAFIYCNKVIDQDTTDTVYY